MKKILLIFAISILSITNANNIKLLCKNNENYISNSNFNKNLKITNGTDVPEGKYPWYGTVTLENNPDTTTGAGGGVLIAPDWFLTAAHVASDFSFAQMKMKVIFGIYDKSNISHIEKRLSKKIIILGGNNYDITKDIALIQLDKPIIDIKPIKVATSNQIPKSNEIVTAIGFGISGIDKQGKAIWPTHMQEANIPVQDANIAKDPKYKVSNFNPKYDFLAGTIVGKRINSSLGDSGGPLIQKINGEYIDVGIVSHGAYDWVNPLPGIYTSVGAFQNWINNYILTANNLTTFEIIAVIFGSIISLCLIISIGYFIYYDKKYHVIKKWKEKKE
ncbi:S1 family peptidase [Spiroplasma ixodetis]|uniref:S1 family peptidase n=1 Tax=Spiroplasma ixodetis TaxID=2141 RepID=UPI0025764A3E|nr:serine protease [Spiroplasma ixodetis]WJG70325.1 tryptase [Spiroplasma ixodetis Y32]